MSASRAPRNSPTHSHKPTSSSRSKGQTVDTHLPSSNQPLPLSIPSSSLAKFPKFTKKDPSSVSLEESHGPLLWQLHQPLAPLPPDAIKNLKSSAADSPPQFLKRLCFAPFLPIAPTTGTTIPAPTLNSFNYAFDISAAPQPSQTILVPR
ncbi:hypothetical protein BS47DRAFT_1398491 [Hydnum rufescens UP504]|uniref:Uncharacterized protein n=1 Tax=Hydnum rufescens UP504 TaxID=1448309 RepID=A0A9P6ALM3_9AGAM|nr:hypothetical protein BS47DRAFT_1398491 [Hydnum rufescens UP504]